MLPIQAFALTVLFFFAQALDQTCLLDSNGTQNCPENSNCGLNNYCVCSQGFVANCEDQAIPLGHQLQIVNLTSNFSYFSIKPISTNFILIQFTICHSQPSNLHEVLNIWYDDGGLKSLEKSEAVGSDKTIAIKEGCIDLLSPFFKFGNQPNGEMEFIIFGIKLHQEGESILTSIKIDQKQIFGFDIFIRIAVVLGIALVVACMGGLSYCIYRFRLRQQGGQNQEEIKHNLDYFNEFMPEFKATDKNIAGDEVCSICLMEIEEGQTMRKTVCEHIFHSDCLQCWCLKNLNCPFCRASLELESLQMKKEDLQFEKAINESMKNKEPLERELNEINIPEEKELRVQMIQ